VVKDIMKQYTGEIDVVEINTDDLAETSAECGVVSIPTIQFYYRGELLDTIVGCVAKSVLSSAVSKVLEDIAIDNNFDDSTDSGQDS
jgi:thioredoxin 1